MSSTHVGEVGVLTHCSLAPGRTPACSGSPASTPGPPRRLAPFASPADTLDLWDGRDWSEQHSSPVPGILAMGSPYRLLSESLFSFSWLSGEFPSWRPSDCPQGLTRNHEPHFYGGKSKGRVRIILVKFSLPSSCLLVSGASWMSSQLAGVMEFPRSSIKRRYTASAG